MMGNRKYLVVILQLFLIVGSCYLLYTRLSDPDLNIGLKAAIKALNWWQIAIILVLSVVFWLLDTYVWKIIMSPFAKIPLKKALRFNVISQSAGILTPFLVGDYGLRSALLRHYINSRQNTLITLAYQLIKVITRIIIGVLAALIVAFSLEWSFVSVLVAVLLLLGGAFAIKKLLVAVARNKRAEKLLGVEGKLDFSKLRTKRALLPAVGIFTAFSLQTALLVYWLEGESSFITIWLTVILTYSITSFMPPLSIFDPVAKSAVGALLYADFAAPNVLLFAFTATWLVNRGIPALISGVFFRRLTNRFQETANSTT